jgi:toxin ParE1/3/4
MGQQIRWGKESAEDLEEIYQYIARNSENYAQITVSRIVDSFDDLENFPLMGREVPEFNDPTVRELIVYSYRAIYKVRPGAVLEFGSIPLSRPSFLSRLRSPYTIRNSNAPILFAPTRSIARSCAA